MRGLIFVIVLITGSLAGCLDSKTGVEGRVLDRDSREPIAGAEVKATSGPGEHKTTTDADGRYFLEIPAGDWKIRARSDGYEDSADVAAAVKEGDVTETDLFLAKETK